MVGAVINRDRAYHCIRDWIADGDLEPGARLSDVTLAKRLGVSRTPVREAINRLESEGLVEQVPRFGAFVRRLSRREVEELYDLRALLEGYAAEQAAPRITDADLQMLDRIVDRLHEGLRAMRDAGRAEMADDHARAWVSLDVAFHMIIVRASDNAEIARIVAGHRLMTKLLSAKPVVFRDAAFRMHVHTWASHKRIVRSLRRRDGQAARYYMARHIERGKARALRGYDDEQTEDASALGGWSHDIGELITRAERLLDDHPA